MGPRKLLPLFALVLGLGSLACDADHETDPPIRRCVQPIVPLDELEESEILIQIGAPIYPEEARRLGHEGTVVMLVVVDYDGAICSVRVDESSGYPELDQASIASARTAKFAAPRSRRGSIPVRTEVRIPFRFSLNAPTGTGQSSSPIAR